MHVPVLFREVVELLLVKPGETVIDATAGFGGHSKELCRQVGQKGTILLIDQDADALRAAKKALRGCPARVIAVEENFRHVGPIIRGAEITPHKILFDLGLSSYQLEKSGRGFSFLRDEPLSMRMATKSTGLTAGEIVNTYTAPQMLEILESLGEERMAKRIVRAIIAAREQHEIRSSGELAAIIEEAVPRRGKTHPATKTFQALRMAANDELGAIREGLGAALKNVLPGGRVAVISFHSLEDRIVKQMFRDAVGTEQFRLINKKPIVPSREEVIRNPRSRSAKLRVIEKISI